jgi:hypothetical protein
LTSIHAGLVIESVLVVIGAVALAVWVSVFLDDELELEPSVGQS